MAEVLPAPRKKVEGDYHFGRIIGEGSFSTVYLARDTGSLKEVAIKVCGKDQIRKEKKQEAIMREKEVMNKITANWNPEVPFFVRLIATFHNDANLYFVMTLAKRGDMFRFIKRMADMEVDVTQFYTAELVQALEHLHSLGIVHRDLKPENILLSAAMHILVTDFGSAKLMVPAAQGPPEQVEAEGQGGRRASFVGTAQYVSPEVLAGQPTSPASDLWALGCIVYQMVTGMPPFVSQSEYLIFQKIQAKDYTFPEGFDPAARDLVTRLLELAPGDRPDCAEIKAHSFLAGVDWSGLHRSVPPGVPDRFIADPAATDPVWERQPGIQPGLGAEEMSRLLRDQIEGGSTEDGEDELEDVVDGGDSASCTSEGSCLPDSGNIGDISDGERERLLGLQRANNEYHALVDGRLVLKQGILDKKRGLRSRRRMFLLTEGPRLFYVDPRDKSLKGEIPWSSDMKTEMKDFRIFFVHTPGRVYYLIDPSSFASRWCEAIDGVRNFYFPSGPEP